MVQNCPKLAQTSAHGTNGESEFWFRIFEPNLACARATSNFLADSKSFLSCVNSVEFSDVRTKSFVITCMNFIFFISDNWEDSSRINRYSKPIIWWLWLNSFLI